MDGETRKRIEERNEAIIAMVIERAKRDFPEDIALVGVTGSYATGDFHEGSDLDLIIVNQTDRGWGISHCFILGEVGFDIYCTPWSPRIEAQSKLESPMVSCLTDLDVRYCAKPEYLERFRAYRGRALALLGEPIGEGCIGRAERWLDEAKRDYADCLLAPGAGRVRQGAAKMSLALLNALASLNNARFTKGMRRYPEQVAAFERRPEGFMERYGALIAADSVPSIRGRAFELLGLVRDFASRMREEFAPPPEPSREGLRGSYEELWCNYRNKVLKAVRDGDVQAAYRACCDAQEYYDEMRRDKGTPDFDLARAFDAADLESFRDAFLASMEEYLGEYRKLGLEPAVYASLEELSAAYLGVKA